MIVEGTGGRKEGKQKESESTSNQITLDLVSPLPLGWPLYDMAHGSHPQNGRDNKLVTRNHTHLAHVIELPAKVIAILWSSPDNLCAECCRQFNGISTVNQNFEKSLRVDDLFSEKESWKVNERMTQRKWKVNRQTLHLVCFASKLGVIRSSCIDNGWGAQKLNFGFAFAF